MTFGGIDLTNDPAKTQDLLVQAGFSKGLTPLEDITSVGFRRKTREYGEIITAMPNEQGFSVSLTVLEPAARRGRLYHRPGGGPGHRIDCGRSTGSPQPDRPPGRLRLWRALPARLRTLRRPESPARHAGGAGNFASCHHVPAPGAGIIQAAAAGPTG